MIGLFIFTIILFIIFNVWSQKLFEILYNDKTIDFLKKLVNHDIPHPERVIRILVNAFIAFCWISYLVIFIIIYLIVTLKHSFKGITRESFYNNLPSILFVISGTIILLWPALHNGYPLVSSDSGTYIRSPRPLDRPVGYYLLILITTLRLSLWLVIFYQALFTSYLMFRNSYLLLRREGLNKIPSQITSFGILILVVILTDLPKYVSWVMPDIFTSWIFLGGMLYLLSSEWYDKLIAYTVISISFLTHGSHILIIFSSLFLLLVIGIIYRKKIHDIYKKLPGLAYIVTLLTIFTCVLNFGLGFGFTLSQNKGNFIISMLVSDGIVSKVLDTYGPTKGWRFYKYKKDLDAGIGKTDDWFLWDKDSPINKMRDWVWEDQTEQNEIISYAVRDYYPEIIEDSLIDTWRLLYCFNSNDRLRSYASPHLSTYEAVKFKYPNELDDYLKSRQQRGLFVNVRLIPLNEHILQYIFISITLVILFFFIYKRQYKSSILLISAIIFIILNAWICASLSTIIGRYNGRVFWLIQYCLFLSLFVFLIRRRRQKTKG